MSRIRWHVQIDGVSERVVRHTVLLHYSIPPFRGILEKKKGKERERIPREYIAGRSEVRWLVGTSTMTRRYFSRLPSTLHAARSMSKRISAREMRTANDLPVKQFVRVGVLLVSLTGLSHLWFSVSLSFSRTVSFSLYRFFLCLLFCFPSSSRAFASAGLAVVRVLKAASSNPPPSPLTFSACFSRTPLSPPALPPHLQLGLFLLCSLVVSFVAPISPQPISILRHCRFSSSFSFSLSLFEHLLSRLLWENLATRALRHIEVLSKSIAVWVCRQGIGGMHLSGRNCRHLATWKMSFDQFALYDRVVRVGSGSRSGCESSEQLESRFDLSSSTCFFFGCFFLTMTPGR